MTTRYDMVNWEQIIKENSFPKLHKIIMQLNDATQCELDAVKQAALHAVYDLLFVLDSLADRTEAEDYIRWTYTSAEVGYIFERINDKMYVMPL